MSWKVILGLASTTAPIFFYFFPCKLRLGMMNVRRQAHRIEYKYKYI